MAPATYSLLGGWGSGWRDTPNRNHSFIEDPYREHIDFPRGFIQRSGLERRVVLLRGTQRHAKARSPTATCNMFHLTLAGNSLSTRNKSWSVDFLKVMLLKLLDLREISRCYDAPSIFSAGSIQMGNWLFCWLRWSSHVESQTVANKNGGISWVIAHDGSSCMADWC